MFAGVAPFAKYEVDDMRSFRPTPSVRAVARHLPVLIDEDFVPVIPDRTTSHDPERFPVNNINGYRLQS